MANPTSNFNWQMPTSSDLVTDLPADFEVFGQAVDTSLADLKGGTTGQVLKKNSNTDMDFVWGTDSAGMTNPMTTTGDTIYSSSGSTPARLGIGTTGQILTVVGGVPAWAAPAGGGKVLQVVMGTTSTAVTNATATYADSNLTASITPSASTSKVLVLVSQNFGAKRLQEENGVSVRLMRGATSIMENTQWMEYRTGTQSSNQSEFNQTGCLTYLDSPATTSSTTYKTQFYSLMDSNTASAFANQSSQLATMILLEIGA
jgi:hypothetical protein